MKSSSLKRNTIEAARRTVRHRRGLGEERRARRYNRPGDVYPRKTTGGQGYVRVHIYVFTCINLHTRTNTRGHIDTRHTWAFTYFHEALQVLL